LTNKKFYVFVIFSKSSWLLRYLKTCHKWKKLRFSACW